MNILPINKEPVIIDGPGIYRLRNGGRARIYDVKPYVDPKGEFDRLEVTAFEAKGWVERMFRGRLCFRGLDAWHVSGRRMPVTEDPRDIVSKEAP